MEMQCIIGLIAIIVAMTEHIIRKRHRVLKVYDGDIVCEKDMDRMSIQHTTLLVYGICLFYYGDCF